MLISEGFTAENKSHDQSADISISKAKYHLCCTSTPVEYLHPVYFGPVTKITMNEINSQFWKELTPVVSNAGPHSSSLLMQAAI